MNDYTKDEIHRYCNWKILLYPDNPEHLVIYDTIVWNDGFCSILHDKDVDVNGELKKPHYHIVLWFKSACTHSQACKKLGITEENKRFIMPSTNKNHDLAYLIHCEQYKTDKHQYSIDECYGDLIALQKAVNSVSSKGRENHSIQRIFELIDSGMSFQDLYTVVLSESMWDVFRRNYIIIKDYYRGVNKNG